MPIYTGTGLADEQQKGGVWELFSKTQRNTLYLHKQRLVAMEELKKLQDENSSLLQEMEVLEMEREGIATETSQPSSFCASLLRVDALAISGRIGTAEASNLRKKVVEIRSMIQSSFHYIHHKPDNELLTGLRLLLSKTIEQSVHDHHNIAISEYIISTHGDMSLSQALDDIKNDRSQWDLRIKDETVYHGSLSAMTYIGKLIPL